MPVGPRAHADPGLRSRREGEHRRTGSCWTIATWSWSRTSKYEITTLYFSSIMAASNSTPTRHLLLRDKALVKFSTRRFGCGKVFVTEQLRARSWGTMIARADEVIELKTGHFSN